MICYPADLTELEIAVINDYWEVSDESPSRFLYKFEEINDYYRDKISCSASFLVSNSSFFELHSAFICQDCNCKIPILNQKQYKIRSENEESRICSNCLDVKQQSLIDSSHMICYPVDVTESEIAVLNEYWLVSDKSFSGFVYNCKEIIFYYEFEESRSLYFLVNNSRFVALLNPLFACKNCNRKIPVKNRQEYKRRIQSAEVKICSGCLDLKSERPINDAHGILKEYKIEKFNSIPCLDSLTIEELLALLSISAGKSKNLQYLGESPASVSIFGVKSIDNKILLSLIDKKALVYIPKISLSAERESTLLCDGFDHITYDNRDRKPARDKHPDSAVPGVYMNPPALGGGLETSDINVIIYQKLQTSNFSIDDVEKVHQIIKEMQVGKLYKLVVEISKKYEISIDNSNILRALLNHLADNYPPLNIYFTFNIKARDTIVYIHKQRSHGYIEKSYFAKFVGSYIQYIESQGLDLEKTWTLPPEIQISPFEALFSQLYLNGHFNLNKLSAKEAVALWLENVCLSEDIQKQVTEDA